MILRYTDIKAWRRGAHHSFPGCRRPIYGIGNATPCTRPRYRVERRHLITDTDGADRCPSAPCQDFRFFVKAHLDIEARRLRGPQDDEAVADGRVEPRREDVDVDDGADLPRAELLDDAVPLVGRRLARHECHAAKLEIHQFGNRHLGVLDRDAEHEPRAPILGQHLGLGQGFARDLLRRLVEVGLHEVAAARLDARGINAKRDVRRHDGDQMAGVDKPLDGKLVGDRREQLVFAAREPATVEPVGRRRHADDSGGDGAQKLAVRPSVVLGHQVDLVDEDQIDLPEHARVHAGALVLRDCHVAHLPLAETRREDAGVLAEGAERSGVLRDQLLPVAEHERAGAIVHEARTADRLGDDEALACPRRQDDEGIPLRPLEVA